MRKQNIQFLENLNVSASLAGVVNIFIGLLIIFMDVIDGDWRHIQIGIYIFITGYSFVKVSQRINMVVLDERKIIADAAIKEDLAKTKLKLDRERKES